MPFFFFFRALRWLVFFLSELYLILKTVKGRCHPLPVLEDFHWSDRFFSGLLPGSLPPPSLHLYRSANLGIALQVID